MNQRKFNCTLHDLYAVCTLGWENCSQHLGKFQPLKPKYTAAFIKEQKTEIERVMKMPDQYKRSANGEKIRINLTNQLESCVQAWKKLKSYILEAWPEQEHDLALRSAGEPYYRDASKKRWEACTNMLQAANTFIPENKERLLANNNMPKSFPDEFAKLVVAFAAEYAKYLDNSQQSSLAAHEKVEASNELYKRLMSMFSDARMIFAKQPEMLKYFTFDSLLSMVGGTGSAGIKGMISSNKVPPVGIKNVTLVLEQTGDSLAANPDGSYRFNQLAAGTYTMRVESPGYKPVTVEGIVVQAGVHTVVNMVMEAINNE